MARLRFGILAFLLSAVCAGCGVHGPKATSGTKETKLSSFETSRLVSVSGRLSACCGDTQSSYGDYLINYTNPTVPDGSHVWLRHGFRRQLSGTGAEDWQELGLVDMSPRGSGQWQARLKKQLILGGGERLTALQFFIEIHTPKGEVLYDKGSNSGQGYFEAAAPRAHCQSSRPATKGYCPLGLRTVLKD